MKSDLIIALIGLSATFVSILGGFLLTIAYNIYENKRKMEFEMELLYMEILKEQSFLSPQLLRKIKDFEIRSHRYSLYINGVFGHIQLPYTTTLDYIKIKKNCKNDKKIISKIRKNLDFLKYSKDFETFARWSNLNRKWKKSSELKEIYEFLSKYQTIENYSLELDRSFFKCFTDMEKVEYKKFAKSIEVQKDQLWNYSIMLPSFVNQLPFIVGILYIILITSIGIIYPLFHKNVHEDVIKAGIISVCLLTIVFISGIFTYGLISKRPKIMRENVRRYHL